MPSLNKILLIGHLGRDPEMRVSPSGDAFCTVSLATTDTWKDRQTGEKKTHTEWHRVVFNGRLAEIADRYLKKGQAIYVEGSVRTRKWTGRDGSERLTLEVRADQMQMLGHADSDSAPKQTEPRAPAYPALAPTSFGSSIIDDDPPF